MNSRFTTRRRCLFTQKGTPDMSHELDGKAKSSRSKEEERSDERRQQNETRRRNRGASDPADWGTADAAKILAVICALAGRGGAVQFGYTRDGGAFTVRILGDGKDPYNEYIRPTEDIDLYLDGLLADFGK